MDKSWENVKMLADKLEWLDERHPAYESIFVEFGENTDEKKELIEDRESVDKLIELFGKEVTAAARKLVKSGKKSGGRRKLMISPLCLEQSQTEQI